MRAVSRAAARAVARRRKADGTVVFVGPSLPARTARALLPGADVRPPAALGDVQAAVRDGARAVVLVDGYFERVPAVWHKELMFVLSRGVRLYGGASMGALRAAELHPYGMIGVGEVFRRFRCGELTGDDEVTVLHATARGDHRALTEALVNMRVTVEAAVRERVIPAGTGTALAAIAKATYYAERDYDRLLGDAADAGVDRAHLGAFGRWLPTGAVDQKRADALRVLWAAAADGGARSGAAFPYERTWIWRDLIEPGAPGPADPDPG
ncbi:TfuA-like protein [Spirillospora sp. NPDC049024]